MKLSDVKEQIMKTRATRNESNRASYEKRKAVGTNKQIKQPSELKPKGRKPKPITDMDIQKLVNAKIKSSINENDRYKTNSQEITS